MINTSLNATAKISLGNAGPFGGSFAVQVIIPTALSTSAVLKLRVAGPTAYSDSGIPDASLTSVRYWSVGTSTLVAAATPITAAGLYVINVPPNCEIVLDNTYTSGSGTVSADRGDNYFPAA
jgi:hypothetical protein